MRRFLHFIWLGGPAVALILCAWHTLAVHGGVGLALMLLLFPIALLFVPFEMALSYGNWLPLLLLLSPLLITMAIVAVAGKVPDEPPTRWPGA